MKAVALLVFACLAVAALAAEPARPTISTVFHASVEVSIRDGDKGYRGGGLFAFDEPNNRGRTDFRYEDPNTHHLLFTHQLDRYDLKAVYLINEDKCQKNAVTGSIPNPWAWIAKATFVGNTTFGHQVLDEWQYTDTTTNRVSRIAVLATNSSHPVYFSTRDTVKGVITEVNIIFLEFDTRTPPEWVFYVPHICQNSSEIKYTDKLKGDAGAAVYFANANWNCADVSCSSRVPAGTGQPGYACAEFVARSLAYGSYFPGLSATAPQSTYGNWRGYNLLYTTHLAAGLASVGFHSGGGVGAASAVFGDAGEGSWSHACIGIAGNTVDCHNNARQGLPANGIFFHGINAVYSP